MITSYKLLLNIKARKKYIIAYARGALTVDSNLSFTWREFFMIKYFIHNGCTFTRKGHVRKGVLTTLTLLTLKWLEEYTHDNRMVFIYLKHGGGVTRWH